MWQALRSMFDTQSFMPHGYCFLWQPGVLWTHVISDTVIFASYYSIPFALIYFARKRPDMPFRLLFGLFSFFILLCGTTHIISVWVLWHPEYGIEGVVKAMTALVSMISAVAIWKLMPQLLMMPSPLQMQKLNAELLIKQEDIAERVNERTTQLAEANAKLEEAYRLADKANKAKSDFLANMSHEIRTPMNAVIGLSAILGQSQPLSPRQQEYVKTLQLSAKSLLDLINDLLDISKIENESITLDNTPFNLHRLLGEVVSIMSVKAREKGIDLSLVFDDGLEGGFIGDENRIRQVFLNLVSNAIKFTEKGFVKVRVNEEKKDARLKYALISVTDTGIGIPPDRLDAVFEKFSQAGHAISNKYGGTGLGLAITRQLISLMGGTISVESQIGRGSAFVIRLPLAATDAAKPPANRENVKPGTAAQGDNSGVILLVEDYQPNILVARTMLESLGYECDVALNGHEALGKLAARNYDLVLMDVQMPEMNGYETSQHIRASEALSGGHIPIIGVTAFAMRGDKEKCLRAGMDDYISKPFMPEELERKMHALLKAPRAA
jgi:signal transduction histidine kinase/CheY-like chemotaxis protein